MEPFNAASDELPAETMVNSGGGDGEGAMPTLGRVCFCALASATAA
jgi:hypothetical protein